jgi:phosphatidylserine/phosphatidylglycerophosphate/cardiolipin synthase-like enzyme
MTWNNDAHGLVGGSREIKGYLPGHSWAMKLSQLHKQPDAMVRIATYSVNADYAADILRRRPYLVRFACNAQSWREAQKLAQELPNIEVRVVDDLHAKMVLIAPATVYVGSANFVKATLWDVSIGVRGTSWHDHYAKQFDAMWDGGDASLLPAWRRGSAAT